MFKEPKGVAKSTFSRRKPPGATLFASSTFSRRKPPGATLFASSKLNRSGSPASANQRRTTLITPVVYCLRLLILGVGIGVIAGTLLSVFDPASRITSDSVTASVQNLQPKPVNSVTVPVSGLKLSQEVKPLKTALMQLTAKNVGLLPGVFFVDLDTGAYVELNSFSTFSAASMIKFPIAVAFFQEVDAGKIRLDEMLSVEPKLIGSGSGEMQYKPPGTKFTSLETVTKMITISDNTATNMLIARMGGAAALNQRFRSWGLTATQIRNWLPDLSGTNTTSPRDLANLMASVNQGELMSLRSRDRLLDIMRHTTINTLLPPGLGAGATIAHKTGDIGTLVGDVGLVDMPSGKRYIAVTVVKRSYNDSRAQELIRQISRVVYQQLNQPTAAAKTGK
ncbi:MAG: serine hydrolase [Chroococcidiopsidaceae cyanobacterium CP_BM_RX_35]|nr:serine hydrolase [Chroococcidiopsidaceae cyanobacterium CP_BM_RX_35]